MGELMAEKNNTLILVGGVAAAAALLYQYLKSSCARNATGALCPTFNSWFGNPAAAPPPGQVAPGATSGATTTPGSTTLPVGTTDPGGTGVQVTPPDPYAAAAVKMSQAAYGAPQTFDGWAWYWQNLPVFSGAPGGFGTQSIGSDFMLGIISAGGGDRTKKISAADFVGYLQHAAAGLAGLLSPVGIPIHLIHHPGY